MKFRTRTLMRVGVTALLAAGGVATAGVPAFAAAADADLAVTVSGLTVAADAAGKFAVATVTNKSTTTTATSVVIVFDLSEVDTSKVQIELPEDPEICEREAGAQQVVCGVQDLLPGANADLDFRIVRVEDGAAGAAGTITVSVSHEGEDAVADNDLVRQPIVVAGNGPDLYTFAFDVPLNEDGSYGAVAPGERAPLHFVVGNQGDQVAIGFQATVKLPKGATFGADFPGCTYGKGRRTAVCEYSDLPVVPEDTESFVGSGPEPEPFYGFEMEIAVDENAKGGVTLTDGIVEVAHTSVPSQLRPMRHKAVPLPQGITGLDELPADVDATDNKDEFAIFVGKVVDGTGGGVGGGDGLPITGPKVTLLAGAGAAALIAGALLFFLARRRRVVVEAPGDAK